MNKEIELTEIIKILTRQLKLITLLKSDLIERKKHKNSEILRELEKEIVTQLYIIRGKKNLNKKPLPIIEKHTFKKKFSSESKKILDAINKGNELIYTKDLTLNILNSPDRTLIYIFSKLEIKINELKESLGNLSNTNDVTCKELPLFTLKALEVIYYSFLEIKLTKEKEVTPFTILLCILKNKNDLSTQVLNNYGITYERLLTAIR